MAAGVTNIFWTVRDLVEMIESVNPPLESAAKVAIASKAKFQ
jgi:hypothetical protein